MGKETSRTFALAEEVLQELAWLGKDRTAEERKRRAERRPEKERALLEQSLRPFNLLRLVLRLKADRAFGHARQILHFMRNSQVVEPELKRVHEELNPTPKEHEQAATVEAVEKPSDEKPRDEKPQDGKPPNDPLERAAWDKALKIVGDPKRMLRLAQFHALCTYKDSGLPARTRLDAAYQILREADDLPSTVDQETLGLAGAINKRLWETEGLERYLQHSLHFYRRGYEVGVEKDSGYTAINAAFVLDLLAAHELKHARDSGLTAKEEEARVRSVEPLRAEANRIREEVVVKLLQLPEPTSLHDSKSLGGLVDEWWFLVTIAEAYFGLGFRDAANFERAGYWLKLAAALPDVPDWEFETTARQLATLGRLRSEGLATTEELWESEPFSGVLRPFLGGKEAGLRATLAGKVGLALSGGGFRAALFHVGVLAKLAELDMLRNVEVLTCVSAGSIIGALYYLELRQLLQRRADSEIARDDYVELVMRVERRFLDAVQCNIRTRLGAEFWTNFKTIIFPNYTRTERAAEMLDEMLFNPTAGLKSGGRLLMSELDILPLGEDAAKFNPSESNWRRASKVPTLVINATTLNTGHVWQFTTDWMGEPATSIDPEIDREPRLRPVRYAHAPGAYGEFPLSRAVAASTCTLGLMEPVTLGGLYPGMAVRLVDGVFSGAQCASAAVERDCNVLLVSDASGQMSTLDDPGQGVIVTTMRSSNILFNQLRARSREVLEARHAASRLRGLMFLHMRKGLDADSHFAAGDDAPVAPDDARPQTPSELTRYGVLKEVQRRLADIRTDIDSFSDTEAYALMMSGYLMTAHEFPTCVTGYAAPKPTRPPWRFLAIEEPMKTVGNKQLTQLLDNARLPLFKFTGASPLLRIVYTAVRWTALVLLPTLLAVYLFLSLRGAPFVSPARWLGSPVLKVALLVLLLFALYLGFLIYIKGKTLSQVVLGVVMCTAGWVYSRFTLHVLDPVYLARGRIGSLPAGAGGKDSTQTGEESAARTAGASRSIGYLSQKVDATGSVKSIGRLIDHARAVEAVARLLEHRGYQATRYPRDQKTNPLQLKLDLHARRGDHQIFAVVRARDEATDLASLAALSELEAAVYMQHEKGQDAPEADGLFVLVDAPPDKKLTRLAEGAQDRGVWIVVASYTAEEAEGFLNSAPRGPALEAGARRLEMLIPSEAAAAEPAPAGSAV